MKKPSAPISMQAGKIEFIKVNATGWEWRDAYHWILSLSWARFGGFIIGVYLTLNALFAVAYCSEVGCIAEMTPGSFPQAFFFSIETWATVGYGHMYPVTVFGHLVATIEIMLSMLWMAVMMGLIFVRFSRPEARIVFTSTVVIAPFDGQPTLMLRVANLRHHAMVEAEFRVMLIRAESVLEEDDVRRFHPLKLTFDRLIMFPAALTLRHVIDEQSPLYGMTLEDLKRTDARLLASVVCIDTVIPAPVQSQHDYIWSDFRFDERFVEIYTSDDMGRLVVDYGRLHETEPVVPRQGN